VEWTEKFIKISIDILLMRRIEIKRETLTLRHKNILCFYEKTVTPFGTSAKIDCPKKFIGKRVYVIVCKD